MLLLTHAEDKYIPGCADSKDSITKCATNLLAGENGQVIKNLCTGGILITGAYNYDNYKRLAANGNLEIIRKEIKQLNDLAVQTLCNFSCTSIPSREMELVIKVRTAHLQKVNNKKLNGDTTDTSGMLSLD